MSKTFCPIPWIMLATRTNGDVRLCCQTNQGPTQGILKNSAGAIYNLGSSEISDTRNAPLACEIRRDMLSGKRHLECLRCSREEDSGLISRRLQEIEMWKDDFGLKDAKKITKKNGEIPHDFESIYYDLRLGNLCNLKCRMCYPTDSSGWYDEFRSVYGRNNFNDTHGKVEIVTNLDGGLSAANDDYDWCQKKSFWKDLENKIKFIKHIYIVGGEPLLIKRHELFLRKCIELGQAEKIRIEYNSNITTITDDLLELWSHFKEIRIGASIDGFDKVNEYIRYPSKWGKIKNNLEKLDKVPGNFKVWIATTVMVYNIYYLPEFIKWKLNKHFLRINPLTHPKPFLALHPLHAPKCLNIKILPPKAKEEVAKKLESLYPWFEEWASKNHPDLKKRLTRKLKETITGYINYMNQDDWSRELPRFWEITRKLDKLRGQNIEKDLPELYEIIKDTEE